MSTSRGAYTSSANIGVYLWSLVSASDLGLVSHRQATRMARRTLTEVASLPSFKGFLYQWYDTSDGHVLLNPGPGRLRVHRRHLRQLLVRLQRRQRLVRIGPGRGEAGPARCAT